ncbi:MAG: 2Fe-2S iron-sulfur cluster binding domain-containing protein, partial [Acidobacteriota bacterium]|nr:2Fe-2S iron-sulfur cluster binding domain-containing protein [Acidobacteriota bacterium]
MSTITFQTESGEAISITASPGENILDLARKANVPIDAPCSGNGSCGKCRVRLLQGVVASPPTIHLDAASYADGWRLACASSVVSTDVSKGVSGDAVFLTPDIASAYRSRLRVTDLSSPEELAAFDISRKDLEQAGFKYKSSINYLTNLFVKLEPPTLDDTLPDNERLMRALVAATGTSDIRLPFPVLKKLPVVLRDNNFEVLCILENTLNYIEIIDIQPPHTENRPPHTICGVAADIGTTTVSALLVDLETGAILAKGGTGNGQIRYGADVIHRIMEQEKPGGMERLQNAVVEETLNPLIDSLCQAAGVARERVYRLTAAGNTPMEHLLLGVPASGVRMEPYIPAFFGLPPFLSEEIGVRLGS